MASVTAYKPDLSRSPQGQQQNWPVFVCRQGIFLFDPGAYFPVDPDEVFVSHHGVTANPLIGHVVLPPCRDKDELLRQPPLGISLTQHEAAELIADTIDTVGTIAATDIGPAAQEKASNQDFALAATIKIASGVYQFAAVADGVTTRTLWPERSARIAVLCAWRVAREHIRAGRGFTHEAFEKFREELVGTIRAALENDMACILGTEDELVPSGWAPDTYRQFKGRKELWYNSTLLVALVGPEGGFVATAGDGGLVVRKTEGGETRSTVLVHSTDDVSVSGVVSLGPDSLKFRQARITITRGTRVELIMSTDGVDRSLRRAASRHGSDFDPYGNRFLAVHHSVDLKDRLDEMLAAVPDREIDNISAAILCWDALINPRQVPIPNFQGSIAANHATVDDINANAEHIVTRGKAEIRNLELELLDRANERLRAIETNLRRGSWPGPQTKRDDGAASSKPSISSEIESTGKIATRMALKYGNLDSKYKNPHVENIVTEIMARSNPPGRPQSDMANFGKVIFYGCVNIFLDRARVDALKAPDIEHQLNLAIQMVCNGLPTITPEHIIFGSREVAQLVTQSLQEAGYLPDADLTEIRYLFSNL